MAVRNPDFKLSGTAIAKVEETYKRGSEDAQAALQAYKLQVEEILGVGWQGAASEEYRNTIEQYEHAVWQYILELEQVRGFMEKLASGSLSKLDNQGKSVGEKMKRVKL